MLVVYNEEKEERGSIMEVLWLILGLFLLLVLVLAANTFRCAINARKLTAAPQSAQTTEEDVRKLQRMIQCQTVSVRGSYDDAEFAKLRQVMREEFPLIHEKTERFTFGDDCWMYKLKGKDESRNILLMSHHDVVAAEGEWKYEPFSATVADGKLWGRGTVDTKTPLFAEFAALEALLAQGYEPPCNVWLGSSHNEELSGDGIPKARDWFLEQGITFEVILDEGGAVIEPPLGGMECEKCAMVAVHEKGRYYLTCTAEGLPGHGSMTAALKASPTQRMACFIREAADDKNYIRRLNPQVKAMFAHLGPYCKFPMNVLFANLWCFGPLLQKVMPKLNPQAGGLIGTTCTFHIIEGNAKKCTATALLRSVDSADMEKDLQTLRTIAAKYEIALQIREDSEYHEPADMAEPGFEYTMGCIGTIFPQYPASPFILPAGTDARTLTDVCKCALRFAPIVLSKQQLDSVHNTDENIDVAAIGTAVAFYRYFLEHYE